MARNRYGTVRQIPKRGGWWVVFRKRVGRKPNGAIKYKFITRFGGRTKKAAEQMSARVWVLIQDGWPLGEAIAHVWDEPLPASKSTTFEGLIDLYFKDAEVRKLKKARTLAGDRHRANVLTQAAWAALDLGSYGRAEVRDWVNERLAADTAAGTINNDLSLASAILRHAQRCGWAEDDDWNPFARCRIARVKRKETVALTLDEYRHLLDAIRRECPDAYPIFLAAGHTGWRAGDLVSRTHADVHWPKKGTPYMEVRAADEKGGTAKRAYLTPQLQAVLGGDEKIRHLPQSLLFRRTNGKPWDSQSLGRRLRK